MNHIFCHTDADGYCAAAAVRELVDPEARVIPMSYHYAVDFTGIARGDIVWVLDFSFGETLAWEILITRVGGVQNIRWFDHHPSAEKWRLAYPDMPGTFSGLHSGAELVWDHLLPKPTAYAVPFATLPRFVRLVGDWDTWRWQAPGFATEMAEAVRAFERGLSRYDIGDMSLWHDLWLDDGGIYLETILENGRILDEAWTQHYAVRWRTFGFNASIGGVECNVINDRGNSLMFDSVEDRKPIQAAFVYDGEKFLVSLYSATVDVGEIALAFGGGGHRGAAGFRCEKLPFKARVHHYQKRPAVGGVEN